MGSVDRFPDLLPSSAEDDKLRTISQSQTLTPRLCVVVAVIYMIAVDNDISEFESSQLQSIVGSDAETLKQAVKYKENHSVEQFLREAAALLDKKDRLCLLINVCDSLMSDGVVVQAEQSLFDRMLAAMGHSKASFQPYFDTLDLKNKTSVFGDFDAATNTDTLTPPLALVASLIYMMASDGSMAEEEVGRLNASIGCSPALLKAGLRYVGKVRAPQFLATAASILNPAQRLCILLNACDAMMADRVVAKVERDLFRRMLNAFSVNEKEFDKYLNIIFLKNDVPQLSRHLSKVGKSNDIPAAFDKNQADGLVFQRKQEWQEETGEVGKSAGSKSGDLYNSRDSGRPSEMESRLTDTMRQNVNRLSDELDNDGSLKTIEQNATSKKSKKDKAAAANGTSDIRALRDNTTESTANKNSAESQGHSDTRALRDNNTSSATNKTTEALQGESDVRALRDTDADNSVGKQTATNEGPTAARAIRDSDTDTHTQKDTATRKGPGEIRSLRDSDADAKAIQNATALEGPSDMRSLRDSEGDLNKNPSDLAEGPADPRSLRDHAVDVDDKQRGKSGDAPATGRHGLAASGDGMIPRPPGMSPELARHLWNGEGGGERRELQDAEGLSSNKRLSDNRNSFDPIASSDVEASAAAHPLRERMDATRNRTYKIFGYVEAIQSARSIVAASRLPLLPLLPVMPVMKAATLPAHGIAYDPTPPTRATWDDGRRTLLASDEGGPIMSEQQGKPPGSAAEASTNKRLRYTSAVLLPALFLTYGATMVGETAMQHGFIVNENIATDARIVHQMASVQQTVYRIAPESVILSMDKLAGGVVQAGGASGSAATVALAATGTSTTTTTASSGADDKELSDRVKADNFLQGRKQELMAVAQSHQGASAVAAERQQWFIYAKSIVLLGLGMAFWGVLFRSMRMLHASTAIGVLSLLLTANGYWLFIQF